MFLVYFAFSFLGNAQNAAEKRQIIDLQTISEDEFIGKKLAYVEDSTHAFNFTTIQQQQFIPVSEEVANFGFSTATHWLRFTVKNSSDQPSEKLLYIQKPLQDSLVFFTGKQSNVAYNGYAIQSTKRVKRGASLYFPLKIPAKTTQTFYLKINSKYGKAIAANIINKETFHARERAELIAVCLLIGALLTIAIYNLFLAYSLKDFLYVWYALAILGALATQLTARGFMKNYLILDIPFVLHWSPPFFISAGTVATSIFCIKFLNTKKYSVLFHKLLWSIAYFMIAAFVIELTLYEIFGIVTTNRWVAIGLLMFGFVALFAGIVVYKNGNKTAKYLIYAWAIYCFTIVIYVLTLLAWVSINGFTTNAYMVGSILEVILLSLALGDRYNQLRFEKEQLTHSLINKEHDIAAKKQEIISLMTENAQQFKTKNQIMENLKKLDNEEEGVSLKSILLDLKTESHQDAKYLAIKENIEIYHLEFISKFKELFPKLTKTDIEIASYAKLRLSRKEIADLRNTSQEAVKSARARLKKKLGLAVGVSLDDFLNTL